MIPKSLKDRIIALKLTWNFAKWQDLVIAYVSNYRNLKRHSLLLVEAIESNADPLVIEARISAVKNAFTISDQQITSANQ